MKNRGDGWRVAFYSRSFAEYQLHGWMCGLDMPTAPKPALLGVVWC